MRGSYIQYTMNDIVYLDNAATSFPKPRCVLSSVNRYLRESCGNPGRGSHKLAIIASEAVYETRELVADHICSSRPQNIIFTPNATYGLNMVIKGLINEKCNVIISNREHNSVIRPLHNQMAVHGGSISVFSNTGDVYTSISSLINEDTKAVIVNLTSNVTGDRIDLDALAKIKRNYDVILIVDASQALGHDKIDVTKLECDALIAPGHKALFGLQGSGFIYLKDDFLKSTLTEGGNGYETFNRGMGDLLPEKYEAGTLATPSIVGLGEGIKFIRSIGIDNIKSKIDSLTCMTTAMLSDFPGIKILGGQSGIISFNYKGYPSHYISGLLEKYNIATRSGFHCAPLLHEHLKTNIGGAVRISLSFLNKKKDIDHLYKSLRSELNIL